MNATEVIEAYVEDTVRFLPRSQRADVAAELQSLLEEELQARATETGHTPDETLALSLVRAFGRPSVVAARYRPVWTIIDPADSSGFVRAAVVGAGSLLVLGGAMTCTPGHSPIAGDVVKIGILAWLGFLVLAFGTANWIRCRWPATATWKPHDRDRVSRVGTFLLVPVAVLGIVTYAAPAWVLDRVSGGKIGTSWASYTADFQGVRLPLLLGLMSGLLILHVYAAGEGRWRRVTRHTSLGLNIVLAGLVLSLAVRGGVFRSSEADLIARNVLALVAAIYVPCVAVRIHGELGRIERDLGRPDPTAMRRGTREAGSVSDAPGV